MLSGEWSSEERLAPEQTVHIQTLHVDALTTGPAVWTLGADGEQVSIDSIRSELWKSEQHLFLWQTQSTGTFGTSSYLANKSLGKLNTESKCVIFKNAGKQ